MTHTDLDETALTLAGIDPDSTQPRERAVHCPVCGMQTWHLAGYCSNHHRQPAQARRAS